MIAPWLTHLTAIGLLGWSLWVIFGGDWPDDDFR